MNDDDGNIGKLIAARAVCCSGAVLQSIFAILAVLQAAARQVGHAILQD